MPAPFVGHIYFFIGTLLIYLEVSIPEYGAELHIPREPVDIDYHNDVRAGAPLQLVSPGIHAEYGDGPVPSGAEIVEKQHSHCRYDKEQKHYRPSPLFPFMSSAVMLAAALISTGSPAGPGLQLHILKEYIIFRVLKSS